jgi:hypothetical protein
MVASNSEFCSMFLDRVEIGVCVLSLLDGTSCQLVKRLYLTFPSSMDVCIDEILEEAEIHQSNSGTEVE